MPEASWKQKTLLPIELSEGDPSYNTVLDLLQAIKNNGLLNIAVTGPYGSGKSSVLKTFQEKVDDSTKILDISLATLDADNSVLVGTIGSESSEDEQKSRQVLNRKIEYSILQQLVYRKTLEALPYSRLKKIRHISSSKVSELSGIIGGVVLCAGLSFKMEFLQIPLLYDTFSVPLHIQSAISLIAIIFLVFLAYDLLTGLIRNFGGFRPQKISVGGNEVDINDEGSIFNRHLDEILYFFQCTDYNVVIIEDLDRFNTPDIFLKLRELNHLINKSEMVGRTVRFIYAVKDDMFKDSSRSKFFDYITTVIPVITTSNSKDKLKEALIELGHDEEICDEDIRDIAFHIDDMRLLYNIVNEYHQYSLRLNSSKEHPLESRKMLAMMVVKNYHPHDFSELHNRNGKLYTALSPHMKRQYIDFAVNTRISERIKFAKEKVEEFEKICQLSARELRMVYLQAITSDQNFSVSSILVNGQFYPMKQLAEDESLFDTFVQQDSIQFQIRDVYGRLSNSTFSKSFKTVEKELNPSCTYHNRLDLIKRGKEEIETELRDAELEINRVSSYSIKDLLVKFSIYKESFFKQIELSPIEEDFIRGGLLDEDYNDYISYFYPGILSLADHQLCLDMKLDRETSFDARIDNIEAFLQELPDRALHFKSTWNYYLADYLSIHSSIWKNYYELYIDNLVSSDSNEFLVGYVRHGSNATIVYRTCMIQNAQRMWNKIAHATQEDQKVLYSMWLTTCQKSDIKKNQTIWINNHYQFVSGLYNSLVEPVQEVLTSQMLYAKLTEDCPDMLSKVVNNQCYVLNKENISIVVVQKCAKDDISLLSDQEEMQLAIQEKCVGPSWYNVKTYYNACGKRVDESLIKFIVDGKQFLKEDQNGVTDDCHDLFQSLLENGQFDYETYAMLCNIYKSEIDFSSQIQSLEPKKLAALGQYGKLSKSIHILGTLVHLSSFAACEYTLYYRDSLSEFLQGDIMATSFAETLLDCPKFNSSEYQKIIGSLNPSEITVTPRLADLICLKQSEHYSVCDESILLQSIEKCSHENYAVWTATRIIEQSGLSHSTIVSVLNALPGKYKELLEQKKPKFEKTNYNELLLNSLERAHFISSVALEDGMLRVNPKRNK